MSDETRFEIGPVVVGVDSSPGAIQALEWAADEARLRGARLEVVHAWAPPAPLLAAGLFAEPDPEVFGSAAKAILMEAMADAHLGDGGNLKIEPMVIRGYPATVLLQRGAEGILVLGSRGLGGFRSLVLGSVSQQCAAHATAPVVVVPAGAPPCLSTASVVVGIDGSSGADRALDVALAEAARRHVRLAVVHAWWTPYPVPPVGFAVAPFDDAVFLEESRHLLDVSIDAAKARAAAVPEEIDLLPVAQPAAPALLQQAADAALLVVGSRGRGGFAGLMLGSVSQQCLHHAPCAVMVVPEPVTGPGDG